MAQDLLTWVPLIVSVTALLLTAVFNAATLFDRRSSARLAREKDLHEWVQKVAEIYSILNTEDNNIQRAAISKLWIMIDYGRLLFPNETTRSAVQKYPRGLRSSVLDPLVETHWRCERGIWDAVKIREDWREFTDQLNRRTTAFAVNTSPEADSRTQYRNP